MGSHFGKFIVLLREHWFIRISRSVNGLTFPDVELSQESDRVQNMECCRSFNSQEKIKGYFPKYQTTSMWGWWKKWPDPEILKQIFPVHHNRYKEIDVREFMLSLLRVPYYYIFLKPSHQIVYINWSRFDPVAALCRSMQTQHSYAGIEKGKLQFSNTFTAANPVQTCQEYKSAFPLI